MNFDSIAQKTILQISDKIESSDEGCLIDIEYAEGILTLITNQGTYILNKNSPAQEIWLSSPLSGAHHFQCHNEKWINKDNDDLYKLIYSEIEKIIGIKIY